MVVIVIRFAHIHTHLFQLDEQQRDAVHKADNIRPSMIQCSVNLHFLHGKKVVVGRIVKVDDTSQTFLQIAVWQTEINRHAAGDEAVLQLVGLHGCSGKGGFQERLDHAVSIGLRHPAIQAEQRRAQILGEQYLTVVGAAQHTVWPQCFLIVGIDQIPAQLIMQQISRHALNKDVFGIVVAHGVISFNKYAFAYGRKTGHRLFNGMKNGEL